MQKLNPKAIGFSAGLLSAVGMLIISVFAAFGVYKEAFEILKSWYFFLDLSVIGVIIGIIEAFVINNVIGFAFAKLYNAFSNISSK
jgi:hypothetical protein